MKINLNLGDSGIENVNAKNYELEINTKNVLTIFCKIEHELGRSLIQFNKEYNRFVKQQNKDDYASHIIPLNADVMEDITHIILNYSTKTDKEKHLINDMVQVIFAQPGGLMTYYWILFETLGEILGYAMGDTGTVETK